MAKYKVTYVDANGNKVTNKKEATDEKQLYTEISSTGGYVIQIKRTLFGGGTPILSTRQTADFCQQLGVLVHAGVSLVRALNIMSSMESVTQKEKNLYKEILALIKKGMSLSDAMAKQSGAFPTLLIFMVRAAESSGNIDKTLATMSEHYEESEKTNQIVKSALVYPKILGVMIVGVVIGLVTFILPQFSEMFAQLEELPLATRILMWASDQLIHNWYSVILCVLVGFSAIKIALANPKIKYYYDFLIIRMPVIGKLNKTIITSSFAGTLSSLYSSGVPIITALQIAKDTIQNTYISSQFSEAIDKIRKGEVLSKAISKIDGLNAKLSSSIEVGEESGNLDEMLKSISAQLAREGKGATSRLVALLEPIMIVVMAAIVGGVMIAILVPIYNSYSTY